MAHLVGALLPFQPFPEPVPVPVSGPFDDPLVTVCINAEWVQYVVGALQALVAQSTWSSANRAVVDSVVREALNLIAAFAALEPCPVPIEFQPNPAYPQNWQYSLDGGVTWLDGPDVASSYTPEFIVDGTSPSGYELSVNGDHSATDIPTLTATDPDAVILDPATLLRNSIQAGTGAEGLLVGALAHIGVQLVQTNGIAAEFNKIPGLGLATSVLMALDGGTDYTYDLLAMLI